MALELRLLGMALVVVGLGGVAYFGTTFVLRFFDPTRCLRRIGGISFASVATGLSSRGRPDRCWVSPARLGNLLAAFFVTAHRDDAASRLWRLPYRK
jgi:hypothetical protein